MNDPKVPAVRRQTLLNGAAVTWWSVAAVGQIAFVAFILAFYGSRTLVGAYPAWNDKPLIQGYEAGDAAGNLMFIAHVLLAAAVTLAGLVQLVPAIRRRAISVHRWNGRCYLAIGCFLALGGLWLVWGRGTRFSDLSALPTSLNALLILLFAGLAWRHARAGRIDAHRRQALRAFMAINGVWFMRVGVMAWILANQGPRGMNETMTGPADLFLAFGSFLIPLAVLELYFRAQRSAGIRLRRAAVVTIGIATLATAVGVFGTVALMWLPYL